MDKNIKAVFDDVCAELSIDSSLGKRLNDHRSHFVNRNSEHIAFFGGNLLGVQIVRFIASDRNDWFNNILECDELDLQDRLYSLDSINPDFQVSSDVMNLSCLWLAHAIERNARLSSKQREESQLNTMMILNIKLITSLLYNYFKYPADEAIARATYDALSYKYTIKQEGSWNKVLERRSLDILDSKSIHAKTLKTFDKDVDIVYMINDIQGRLRDMVKNIYAVFMQIHQQGIRISSSSSMVEHDGVEVLKDKTRSLATYTRYVVGIIPDQNSFLKEDLLQVIEKTLPTMPPHLFRTTLKWMSEAYGSKHTEFFNEAIERLMVHAFDYLNANRTLMRNTTDLPQLITKLKGTYMSSRNNDPDLKRARVDFEKIANLATGNKNNSILSSIRTGLMLYIVVRAISMKHYTRN